MAKQPYIVGLFTGISNQQPLDPSTMTAGQYQLAMQARQLQKGRQGIVNALGKQTSEQKLLQKQQEALMGFNKLPIEEQKRPIMGLQAAVNQALAGPLATELATNQKKQTSNI